MKFRKVLGKAFWESWNLGKRGQLPLAQLAHPSLCILLSNSPAGWNLNHWFQLGCRQNISTWKQTPGSQECSYLSSECFRGKYFCQVRIVPQGHTSQIVYRFWLHILSGFDTHTKFLIYNIKVISYINRIIPKMNELICQESIEKHQECSLVTEYIFNMSTMSGSIPPPKNLLNAINKKLCRRKGKGGKGEERGVGRGRSEWMGWREVTKNKPHPLNRVWAL